MQELMTQVAFSIKVWMAGEEETGHWALVQHEKFNGNGVGDGNRHSADMHSRIVTTWSYNEVVELGNCLKMKENE